jgi:hypothetical protein
VLVLCTGMPRSASTWSFNVIKQLLARVSGSMSAGFSDAIGEPLQLHGQAFEHVIVKSHNPDALGRALIKQRACRTVYTYREPLHSILSASETFGGAPLEKQIDTFDSALELMRYQFEAGGVLLVWYGDVIERTRDVVQVIADYLGLALPGEAITEVAAMLSRENVRRVIRTLAKSAPQTRAGGAQWDNGTQFSNHHIRDNPSDPGLVFSAAQIARIAERLSGYVDADAALRPEIRALGMLGGAGVLPTHWPEPVAPEPPAAPAIETPPIEALPLETPPGDASPVAPSPVVASPVAPSPVAAFAITASPIPATPLDAPEPPEAPPADAEPPEAPSIDAAAEPPQAAPIAATPTPPLTPPVAPAGTPPGAPPAAVPAKVAAAPRGPAYDPVRDAARRTLARDLLGTLGRPTTGKSRVPGSGR